MLAEAVTQTTPVSLNLVVIIVSATFSAAVTGTAALFAARSLLRGNVRAVALLDEAAEKRDTELAEQAEETTRWRQRAELIFKLTKMGLEQDSPQAREWPGSFSK